MMVEGRVRCPELLAPAGGPVQFNAALAAGADAIYCGYGRAFNARRGAESFTAETFGEACRAAHLAGSRVYVTVNVVVRDDELASALALVRRAWLLGADAFIIQDWGLLREVRRLWPQLECHLSTQANVHDARGVVWAAARGVARVTLSRELSLDEIATIAREGVDLECFGHGALCFCYSGICQMSSLAGGRSANRGTCAQPCRLPYELVDGRRQVISLPDRGRPLCPRDYCTFDDLAALRDAGVASLKVEGRLKGADYVHAVVSAYRQALDDLAADVTPCAGEVARRHTMLKRAFNRDFTNAYLRGRSGDEMMSYERSNNRGELVGTVVESRSFGTVKVRRGGSTGGRERLRTARVCEVDIALDKPIGAQDLLELRPLSDPTQFVTALAPADAAAGSVICVRTPKEQERGALVRVIRSHRAQEEAARATERPIARKRPVHVVVRCLQGQPFSVRLVTADGVAEAEATGDVVEAARTRVVTEADLVSHVGRMGTSPFEPLDFSVDVSDGCGIAFSLVHAVRAKACDLLADVILSPYRGRELCGSPSAASIDDELGKTLTGRATDTPAVCALVADAASAAAALDAGADLIYAREEALRTGTWPDDVVCVLDEVCREIDHASIDGWVRDGAAVAVGNVSELALAQERGARAEVRTCIPVHNEGALATLVEAGASAVWLSSELSLTEIARVCRRSPVDMGYVVCGTPRAMTTEHCVLQVAGRCIDDCAHCALRADDCRLRGDEGQLFPVRTDLKGRSRIYAARVLDAVPQLPELLACGITRLGVDCTLLDERQTAASVRRVSRALKAVRSGQKPPGRLAGAVSGHLFEPIE